MERHPCYFEEAKCYEKIAIGHLRPHLACGDEVLMANGIDHQPGLHGFGGQEDGIAVDEKVGHGRVRNIAHDGFVTDCRVGFHCDSACDRNFGRSLTAQQPPEEAGTRVQVTSSCSHHPGGVGRAKAPGVNYHKVPDTEAGQIFVGERASASSPYDRDLLSSEDLLAPLTKEPHLAVVVGVSVARPSWRRMPSLQGAAHNV